MNNNLTKRDLDLVKKAMLASHCSSMGMHLIGCETQAQASKEKAKSTAAATYISFEKGYNALWKMVEANAESGIYSKSEEIPPTKLSEFAISAEKMSELRELIYSDQTDDSPLYEECDYTVGVLLAFYELSTKLFDDARYDEATAAFIFLTTVDKNIHSFWLGLALCYEKNLDFMKALEVYELAIHLEPSNFTPFYGILRCSESIKDFSKALELLEKYKDNEEIKQEIDESLLYIKSKK